MPRKKYFTVFIAIGITIGAVLLVSKNARHQSLCDGLRCIRMTDSQSYQEKELYSDTPNVYRALYSFGERYIRIEAQRVSSADAEQTLEGSVTRMKALFENAPAPYPGEISDTIVCDKAFAPTYAERSPTTDGSLKYFIGYLNNRMTFGSCSVDQAVYKGIMGFMYCPNRAVIVRVELIAPTREFQANEEVLTSQFLSLGCSGD